MNCKSSGRPPAKCVLYQVHRRWLGGMSRDVEELSGTSGFSAWKNCDIHSESLDFEEPWPLHGVSVVPGKA